MNNIDIVRNHYSKDVNINAMLDRNKMGLSLLEKKIIKRFFKPKGRILDIGCGTGREAIALAKLGYDVVGIDISVKEIEIALWEASVLDLDINFRLCNGLNLDFPDASFDYIIMWTQNFGNLYTKEDQLQVLSEVKRTLKPGGIFCFSVHDKDFIWANYPHNVFNRNRYYPDKKSDCYWMLFEKNGLMDLVNESGFGVIFCDKSSKLVKGKDLGQLVCVCKK